MYIKISSDTCFGFVPKKSVFIVYLVVTGNTWLICLRYSEHWNFSQSEHSSIFTAEYNHKFIPLPRHFDHHGKFVSPQIAAYIRQYEAVIVKQNR